MTDFRYRFTAIRGVQNDRLFYQATVPFRLLASLLRLDDSADANQRSQRLLDKGRAKKVAQYLEKNKDGFYVVPPLVGIVEGDYDFEEVQMDGFENLGRMSVAIDARFVLFDGQHRAYGIREANQLAPELSMQSVSIMFFDGLSLAERKQAFHDINYTQKTPSAALCITYNGRSDFDKMIVDVFSQSNLRAFIEYEKNSVSGASDKIYSLKTLKDFAVNVLGDCGGDACDKLTHYVAGLFDVVNIPAQLTLLEMNNHANSDPRWSAARSLRDDSILPHAVTLKALGLLGRFLLEEAPQDWRDHLQVLANKQIWCRSNLDWKNRCVDSRGKMIANQLAVRLTFYKLKVLCGFELTEAELNEEYRCLADIEEAAV